MRVVGATQTVPAPRRRTILLLSALNLFLIGIIGAFVVRYYSGEPPTHRKAGPAHRIEKIASRLPAEDALILRLEFTKKSGAIEDASDAFRQAREKVRSALRAEPYDLAATSAAMSEAEGLHQKSEQLIHAVIASAAAKMTPEGRRKLAEWPAQARRAIPPYTWLHFYRQ
jgi:uncharacterized membrane protein